jgi:hypothetical protein
MASDKEKSLTHKPAPPTTDTNKSELTDHQLDKVSGGTNVDGGTKGGVIQGGWNTVKNTNAA